MSDQIIGKDEVSMYRERLDSREIHVRLGTLKELREREATAVAKLLVPIGPVLPNYLHVHTTVSYGYGIPGVFSVSRMIWAAHEAGAPSILIIEHETLAHVEEARCAVNIVNQGSRNPMLLALGIEFRAMLPVDTPGALALRRDIAMRFGSGGAAWVVGMRARPSAAISRLASDFQKAKLVKASIQLRKLSAHFGLAKEIELSTLQTTEGNLTDRALCFALATARCPNGNTEVLMKEAAKIRRLLDPGEAGYTPFQPQSPQYPELLSLLRSEGLPLAFTAQLRRTELEKHLPMLRSWGIEILDCAGVEPFERDACDEIAAMIRLAEANHLGFIGGVDYRGEGTGWTVPQEWMRHPRNRETLATIIDQAES